MAGRIIASDVIARRVQTAHFDVDGGVTLNTAFDAEDIVEDAALTKNHLWNGNYKGSKELGLTKIGTIPLPIYFQLQREGRLPQQDPAAFAKWFMEYKAFKTVDGKPI